MSELAIKLGTFEISGEERVGILLNEDVVVDAYDAYKSLLKTKQSLSDESASKGSSQYFSTMENLLKNEDAIKVAREVAGFAQETGNAFIRDLNNVKVKAPVKPSKLICLGRTFMGHLEVGGLDVPDEPHIFLKPTSSIVGPNDTVYLPKIHPDKVTYGAELTVVIGKRGKNIPESEAMNYVAGWTIMNDVTCRGMLYPKNKIHDTFGPIGPYILPKDQLENPQAVSLNFNVNNEQKQNGNTKDIMWDIPYLIHNVSEVMTLEPGDLIALGDIGAPETLSEHDVMEAIIPEIGVLRNPVVKE